MLIDMLLHANPETVWRSMVLGDVYFIKANVMHRQNVTFYTKIINL